MVVGENNGGLKVRKRIAENTDLIVRVDWRSEKSIEAAEIRKARLENAGFVLIEESHGFNESALVYRASE